MFLIMIFTTAAQQLETTLQKLGEEYEPEKMYLHYDKAAYAPGETIWFKGYLMQGVYPAEETKTVYVDWLDEKGNVLFHFVAPVLESSVSGQFEIPSTYKGFSIQVRAYTKWMLNFDTSFLYNKNIPVLQKQKAVTPQKKTISIRFFPEGGDAVAGISTQLAFKANDQRGLPAMVRGIIQTVNGKTLDSFRTVHNGMGSIPFTPAPGEKYKAVWKDESGVSHTTELPAIKESGIVLQLSRNEDKVVFELARSSGVLQNLQQGSVIGTFQHNLIFKTPFDLTSSNSLKRTVPVSMLPTGILTITVLDNNNVPVAERIIFIDNQEYSFTTGITVEHWGLNKRARNELEIIVPDSLATNLSVSVTDAAIGTDSSENIFSGLLLTSDLKGYIHEPAYYFSQTNEKRTNYLDLVMLTHGWRRLNWEGLVKGTLPEKKYPKDTSYLSLSGVINGVVPGSIGPRENIIMIVKQKDSASQMVMAPIKPDGSFSDPTFIFFDSMTVFHQFDKSAPYSNAGIRYLPGKLPPLFNKPSTSLQYLSFQSDTTGNYYNLSRGLEKVQEEAFFKAKVLETVTVRAKTKDPKEVMDEKYTSGLFAGGDAYTFDLVNDRMSFGAMNIFSYLQGRVAGLQITNQGNNTSLSWRGGTPQVYIDEIPTDIGMIANIPVTDIAYVKVFRPPFMGGFGGSGGAIAVYTRQGDDIAQTPGKGMEKATIEGYSPLREFYSPNYQVFGQRNELKDVRTTLYWLPIVVTEPGNGKFRIHFHNNDISESFRVIIQGMSKEGRLTHVEYLME
ncbi:MAG: hypothetical protein H0V30_13015 [Chitinophagaceae bacterium]|jgi:hypothetical protein|nr:hypothetical protein [Chitinophagaceae bacterium]